MAPRSRRPRPPAARLPTGRQFRDTRRRSPGAAASDAVQVEAPESESMQSDNAPLEQPSLLSPARPVAPPRWGALADYLSLTKPRIIVLLLVTTLGAMVVAAGGWPSWPLVAATLLGGALASGAGNALNCYLDRDIDALMGRTVWRPLPSGALAPGQALAFGLSLAGLWFYVLVHARWLKRTTPSNIVIGGAAGAVPPLVGWAAVTGELSLLAWCLFAIVFYWTPPHFWALALLIREEYAKARVPMLPLVAGDAETRRQILWYSVLLLAVSLLPFAFGLAGLGYLVAAGGLGGLLVRYAVRLCREATRAAALALYKYSLLYLALVFTALVADRLLGG